MVPPLAMNEAKRGPEGANAGKKIENYLFYNHFHSAGLLGHGHRTPKFLECVVIRLCVGSA
jgi:hypothetical protein